MTYLSVDPHEILVEKRWHSKAWLIGTPSPLKKTNKKGTHLKFSMSPPVVKLVRSRDTYSGRARTHEGLLSQSVLEDSVEEIVGSKEDERGSKEHLHAGNVESNSPVLEAEDDIVGDRKSDRSSDTDW